ncbi:MAG: hypothetical protein A3C85_01870 [Candidatus Doudnabacteria bacterium RIFCSPHIGHO2_02_FULL_48_21]|uniref:Glutamyl-tRNA amidotransferase n=1 Tax=Candidatus Doudnabacteria bacterium RIFCSPLOWO2_02_FULL_48_13 TaxID=1817845 RepID=A0A1F5QA91_9BACT|nr:MAG: hypothetical protein A3K05_02075 [Candidatus Doudnabacteria bacterium RIFCSPHIGHO2_01_48_18]OGE78039.1 MAG: hypothetical protein A2668_03650 [Candidatus Doudnabacteria bacterium RIFCSPHIGHO2_01_FULL_48_180]OGE91362.1 MAG: hypothetical protein A3F44_03625 [Candidatus Doudnabacteria bacterium RIFCSPHIGHO2_12_FULL_47_25]OGE93174.1 MAG: hypothetical protein A3C85_01870 [Candidatus Doudnabacteria bacterium RIFCSPHIGHO2_02_FULL_48_21]OGE96695.1 MAG: hypothetical protein A3A83_02745 [Candidatu
MEKPLKETIAADLKAALKQKDTRKVSVLRMINAEIKNLEIEMRKDAVDADVLKVLNSSAKKHQDSITQFQSGGRLDLVEQEQAELKIIQEYLPEQLGDAELDALIEGAIKETGASSAADFGKAMKTLMPKIQGRANGQIVSQKLKEKLG